MAAAGIAAALGVAPWDRGAVLAAKREFLRAETPEFLPHPFVGQASTQDVGTGGALAGREPLYAARPDSLPERPVRVLVLGGSLAKHLSQNDPHPGSTPERSRDILQRALNAAFATDRFVVYNAATGGGKQPQQLFRLQYLLLLGERFDLVLNVDGFNEIALPLVENVPVGTPAILPRAYPHLLSASTVDVSCVSRSNRYASTHSVVPLVELWRLVVIRRCLRQTDRPAPEAQQAVAGQFRFSAEDSVGALEDAVAIWARSSAALERLARDAGAAYLHVIQPNQYVAGSKPLSEEERDIALAPADDPYRQAIEAHYAALQPDLLRAGTAVDLRQVFADQPETLYRDRCCHLNDRGMELLAQAIVAAQRRTFARLLDAEVRATPGSAILP